MRCKIGDLAILIRPTVPENVGALVEVIWRQESGPYEWLVYSLRGPLRCNDGTVSDEGAASDAALWPIRGNELCARIEAENGLDSTDAPRKPRSTLLLSADEAQMPVDYPEPFWYYLKFDSRTELPQPVNETILELIVRENVQSVSLPYDVPSLWPRLIAEQIRRADRMHVPLQQAFYLSGPDGGFWDTDVAALGGEVHIPYEGMCGGDLVVFPRWRKFFPESVERTGKLSSGLRKCCHYLLTPFDFGDLHCASRRAVGDWVLYQSKDKYVPCREQEPM